MNLTKAILKSDCANVLKRFYITKTIFNLIPTINYRCVENNLFFFG